MGIESNISKDGKTLRIRIDGDFNWSQSDAFKQAYKSGSHAQEIYLVDLQDAHYIDSTALGMLLELRDYAKEKNADVQVVNMNDVVLELFRVMNFHKIFQPSYTADYYRRQWMGGEEQSG